MTLGSLADQGVIRQTGGRTVLILDTERLEEAVTLPAKSRPPSSRASLTTGIFGQSPWEFTITPRY